MNISKLLGRVGEQAGEYSFGGQADTLPAVSGLVMKGVGNRAQGQIVVEKSLLVQNLVT